MAGEYIEGNGDMSDMDKKCCAAPGDNPYMKRRRALKRMMSKQEMKKCMDEDKDMD